MAHPIINLLAQALQPMPYAPIGDQLLLLAAIHHAEMYEDGKLGLSLANGHCIDLSPEDVAALEQVLKAGIAAAQAQAARQAAQTLGIIHPPGTTH